MRHIVAIGGQDPSNVEGTREIHRYLRGLSGQPRPKVCLIPTASAESQERIIGFYDIYSSLSCEPSWLSLFKLPTGDIVDFLMDKDIIFVGGGNTRSMLAIWREWGLDGALRAAYENGVILAGSSAGANCWFEQCTTDSIPGDLTVMSCLGFLKGSFTPHYDVEPKRKPALHRALSEQAIVAGYASDNFSALHFVDDELESALRSTKSAAAYRVRAEGGRVIEEPLEMKQL